MKIYKIKVNGKTYRVELENIEEVSSDPVKETVETKKSETKTVLSGEGTPVLAPIQGNVIDIKVSVGKKVKKGDCLWDIAQKYYGKGSLYPKIKEANKSKYPSLSKSNIIQINWELIIP